MSSINLMKHDVWTDAGRLRDGNTRINLRKHEPCGPLPSPKSVFNRNSPSFLHLPLLGLLIAAFVFSGSSSASAEPSAGQLVPSSYSAPIALPKSGIQLGSAENAVVPPGANESNLKIGDVLVEGLDPQFSADTQSFIGPLRGQKKPVSEIYAVAARIQKLYSDSGSFLTRVVIPPQNVQNGGTVKLKVIEGFIADINVDAIAPEVRGRVLGLFEPLKGRTGLKLPEFQRALLLASGTSGLKLKSNLKPASQSLGVTLTVSGDYTPLTGQVVTDNALSESLGTYETTLSGTINSPFHWGEQLYLSTTGSPNKGGIGRESPRRVFATGVTVPLANNGLSGNLEYTWSNTTPTVSGTALATTSRYQRVSAKLSYPVILDQTTNLTARFGFDDTDEINRATAFDFTLYHDHLEVLRAGLDYGKTFLGGVQLSGGMDLSQGFRGLWSRNASDARYGDAISQAGASDQFTKLQARIHLYQEYDNGLAWDVSGRGQYAATGKLMNAEKFVIGGAGDLSGSDSGGWSGDHGWSARAEFQYDMARYFNMPGLAMKSYVFAARGQIYIQDPSAGELAVDGATGFGVGLRGQWASTQFARNPIDFALEVARNLSDHSSRNPSEWRLNLSVGVRF